jgi:hypothetical protein
MQSLKKGKRETAVKADDGFRVMGQSKNFVPLP